MVTKAMPGKKLAVKKSTVKDLKVNANKSSQVKGGAGRLSKPSTPADPGCTPC